MPDPTKPTRAQRIVIMIGVMAIAYGLGNLLALMAFLWVLLWRAIAPTVCP